MNYHEQKTLEETVNTRGTKLWTQMNDNSKAPKHRAVFVQQHGGFFVQENRYWVWKTPVQEQNGYWLKKVDTGEKVFFSNMSQFAKENGLTSVKICELLNGKRKTYKGWTAVEIRPIKETEGANVKAKEPTKKKVPITLSAIFVDITTNERINVQNISEFAKNNNLDYANLRKLAIGKAKTYKNLKLYNPLEEYNASSGD